MGFKESYERQYQALLSDRYICDQNLSLFKRFFEYEEYKLKRINDLPALDEGCYRTLLGYINRLKNLNKWLKNKPWQDLTADDIKCVYDDLEEGKILNARGQPIGDKKSYYSKIMKSKPFRMVGKSDIAKEVMEFSNPQDNREVRFINEEGFKNIEMVTSQVKYKALLWLAWDYGENINSLLKLKKRQFTRIISSENGEPEYLLNFPKEILKRSRRSRTEPSLYPETVKYLDMMLSGLADNDFVFNFGYGNAKKILNRAVNSTGVKCVTGQKPTWKDFRSGMACHLLNNGWTREEIDARLGHKPSSKELDKYITFHALDRKKSKQKFHENNTQKLRQEIHTFRLRDKNHTNQIQRMQSEIEQHRSDNILFRQEISSLKSQVSTLLGTFKGILKDPKQRLELADAIDEDMADELVNSA